MTAVTVSEMRVIEIRRRSTRGRRARRGPDHAGRLDFLESMVPAELIHERGKKHYLELTGS